MSAGSGRGLFEAIGICFSKYAMFQGRAPRSEYWWFELFNFLVFGAIGVMLVPYFVQDVSLVQHGGKIPPPTAAQAVLQGVSDLYTLAVFLPSLAVTVRRLHDRDKSGWWYFLPLLPIIGSIILLVWLCRRGTDGPNRFGPDPLREF